MASVSITFTGTPAQLSNAMTALGKQYSYQATLADGSTNPEDVQTFVLRTIKAQILTSAQAQIRMDAEAAADAAVANLGVV